MEKLKYAQDLISATGANVMGGFNTFISGGQVPKIQEYGDRSEWSSRVQGYDYASKMAKEDGIAFTFPFVCGKSSDCHPFEYGGFFVCNACGNKSIDKDWWKIQVLKDGDMFHCRGLDFEDLMQSENHAFGETFEKAIGNYGKKMLQITKGD